jgi:TubC N-terminal docking domain
MNAPELVTQLQSLGVVVNLTGNDLDVCGPEEVLSDDLISSLREHKPELLKIFRLQAESEPAIAGNPCPTCGGAVLSESGEEWLHRWCPQAGHYDEWRSLNGEGLADAGAPLFVAARARRMAAMREAEARCE